MYPRCYVGDVVEATETDDDLAIKDRFHRDAEFGKSDYRNTKGRRVSGLSIGYAIRNSTDTAAGREVTDLELIEVPSNHDLIWRVQGYSIRLPGRVAIARYR